MNNKPILLMLLICLLLATESASGKILYSWTQLDQDQKIIARALVDTKNCPHLQTNIGVVEMQPRFVTDQNFPTNLCEAKLSSAISYATIENIELALSRKTIDKILVIGNTNCNQPNKCSFAKIAKLAEKHKPDLIFHLGGFHYHDVPYFCACSEELEKDFATQGIIKPVANNLDYSSLEANFFIPAKDLLNKAPWVILRGDPENCQHSWESWNKFFDLSDVKNACDEQIAPYMLTHEGLHLLIMDSSAAGNKLDNFSNNYTSSLKLIRNMTDGINDNQDNIWFLTHKPIWSRGYLSVINDGANPYNETLYKIASKDHLINIGMNIHSHLHFFQALSFEDQTYPPQIITGNTGDNLLMEDLSIYLDNVNQVLKLEENAMVQKPGFTIFDRETFGWRLTVIDQNNQVQLKCKIANRNMKCR